MFDLFKVPFTFKNEKGDEITKFNLYLKDCETGSITRISPYLGQKDVNGRYPYATEKFLVHDAIGVLDYDEIKRYKK